MISASFGHLEATDPTHLAQPVSAWCSDEPTQPSPSSAECSGEFTQPFMELISRAPPEQTDCTVQPQPLHSEPAACPAQLQLASSKQEVSTPAEPASAQPEVITSAGPALPLPVVSKLAQQLTAATLPPSPQSPSSVAATPPSALPSALPFTSPAGPTTVLPEPEVPAPFGLTLPMPDVSMPGGPAQSKPEVSAPRVCEPPGPATPALEVAAPPCPALSDPARRLSAKLPVSFLARPCPAHLVWPARPCPAQPRSPAVLCRHPLKLFCRHRRVGHQNHFPADAGPVAGCPNCVFASA